MRNRSLVYLKNSPSKSAVRNLRAILLLLVIVALTLPFPKSNEILFGETNEELSAATWIPRSGSEHLAASVSISSPPLDKADELFALADWAPDDVTSFQLACRSFARQLS
jgi:hypothetical protein